MKKTWITKAWITLMTLALVAGVFFIAPTEARADAVISVTPSGAATQSVKQGAEISFTNFSASGLQPGGTIRWAYSGELPGGLIWGSETANPITLSGTVAADAAVKVYTGALNLYETVGGVESFLKDYPISIEVKAKDAAPTIDTVTFASGYKVGTAITAVTVSVTGNPAPTVEVNNLPAGLTGSFSGSTLTISGTPTEAVTDRTVTITAKNGVSPDATKTATITVSKVAATTPTVNAASSSVAKGGSVGVTATTNDVNGTLSWTVDATNAAAGAYFSPSTSKSGEQVTFYPGTTTTATAASVFATLTPSANYSAPSTAFGGTSISITAALPVISISYPVNGNAYAPGDPVPLGATVTGGTFSGWTTDGKGTINDAASSVTNYIVSSQDAGKSVTFTAKAGDATKTVSIYVNNNTMVSSPSQDGGYTLPNVGSTTTLTVSSTNGSALEVWNTAPCNVEVTCNIPQKVTIGETHTQVPSGTVLTIKGLTVDTRSYVKVKPAGASDTAIRTMNYFVGSTTPKISVQFWSNHNDNTLSRYATYGTLKITVTNYNKSYPYVTIRRNNIRTFVQAGSYSSHANTYDYTLQLKQEGDANDGVAYAIIEPQYNGNTHYTVSHQGATSVNSSGIYVTGFPALPQTGPNYTLAYVLGGLCLVTAVTAVTLHVRKKKQKKQED